MCGRTALSLAPDQIKASTGVSNWVDSDKYRPSYNVGPTRYQPVLLLDDTGHKYIRSHKWGLIPFWTKSTPDYTSLARMINARDDSLVGPGEKPVFKGVKNKKRCVVVAEGFFEWDKSRGSGTKVPFFVHPTSFSGPPPPSPPSASPPPPPHTTTDTDATDDSSANPPQTPTSPEIQRRDLLYMAGLWDKATIDGEDVYSYTIVTTSSSSSLGWLHDRMPVILSTSSPSSPSSPSSSPPPTTLPSSHSAATDRTPIDIWLDPAIPITDSRVASLLRPYEGPGLAWYAVSGVVGSVKNDSVDCIRPANPDDVARAAKAKKSGTGPPEKGLQSIAGFFGKGGFKTGGGGNGGGVSAAPTQPNSPKGHTEVAMATQPNGRDSAGDREHVVDVDDGEDYDVPRDDPPDDVVGPASPEEASAVTPVTPSKRRRLLETDSEGEGEGQEQGGRGAGREKEKEKERREGGNGNGNGTRTVPTPTPVTPQAKRRPVDGGGSAGSPAGTAAVAGGGGGDVRSGGTTPHRATSSPGGSVSGSAKAKASPGGSKSGSRGGKGGGKGASGGQQKLTSFFHPK
ncbi:DUF159-domain-containing protein [Gonapodya prolifera JEL478]|uniref:DUF159-domain-containing protein n=1 Tax=Gonapodya prolifera (strain JEL478) TaxID=1344416 RepID=A0A139A3P8_GONPJ|nr:DUF159-domain-containing protein [Gonapodya prolifera JEL478]|eukprot:KXS11289.1 DUF159-domain-containing protein [Gonapodya prolifera JEL478]